MPDTKAIVESDTAKFFPRHQIPPITMEGTIAQALDHIEEALCEHTPAHTDVTTHPDAATVVEQLLRMYAPPPTTRPAPPKPTVSSPRVAEPPPKPAVNTYQPKPKQQYKVGMRAQVPEVVRDKNITFVGHNMEYDARTGLYTIRFKDGREYEFNNSDVEAFRVKAGRPKKLASGQ